MSPADGGSPVIDRPAGAGATGVPGPGASAATPPAWLYAARLSHRRRISPFYRFVYRLFYLLLDIDRLAEVGRLSWAFSVNRFNLLSFRCRDHGFKSAEPASLRAWAESILASAGLEAPGVAGGRIWLLALPRLFGYAFNPVSFWYCHGPDGQLRAVLAEVRNTFGDRHTYVLHNDGLPMPSHATWGKAKIFHVSPFLPVAGEYHFGFSDAGSERLRVRIHESRDGGPVMDAVLAAERRAFTTPRLLAQFALLPFSTFKVVAAIYWKALFIWRFGRPGGAAFHPRPEPPGRASS